jgi:outer membrane protein
MLRAVGKCLQLMTLGSAFSVALPMAAVHPMDLKQALAAAYFSNPDLDAARARLRAIDEVVSQAHGAFRPYVSATGERSETRTNTSGTGATVIGTGPSGAGTVTTAGDLTTTARLFSVTAEQSLFRGLRSINRLREAEAGVRAGQAQLLRVEQVILFTAASAYADVVRDRRVFALRREAVASYNRRFGVIQRRFRENDVTATDVAQARATLAEAQAEQAAAAGELQASEAAFERVVGVRPGQLAPAWMPRERLPESLESALVLAEAENPAVVQALYLEQARQHTVDLIRGERYPDLRLVGSYGDDAFRNEITDTKTSSLYVGLRVSVPLYDGGVIDSRVRQAKHEHVGRIQDIKSVRSLSREAAKASWWRLVAADARRKASGIRVSTLREALQGVDKEEGVGQRSLLDVLEAQRAVYSAQIAAVSAERDLVVNTFGVLQAVGRMTAVKLGVTDMVYDPQVHYEEVRRKPWGTTIITYEPASK